MLRRKSKTQLEHQERNTQNAIALLTIYSALRRNN
jgi:hypothetical protein